MDRRHGSEVFGSDGTVTIYSRIISQFGYGRQIENNGTRFLV